MSYLYILNNDYCILVLGTNAGSTFVLFRLNGKDVLDAPLDAVGKFRS